MGERKRRVKGLLFGQSLDDILGLEKQNIDLQIVPEISENSKHCFLAELQSQRIRISEWIDDIDSKQGKLLDFK